GSDVCSSDLYGRMPGERRGASRARRSAPCGTRNPLGLGLTAALGRPGAAVSPAAPRRLLAEPPDPRAHDVRDVELVRDERVEQVAADQRLPPDRDVQ